MWAHRGGRSPGLTLATVLLVLPGKGWASRTEVRGAAVGRLARGRALAAAGEEAGGTPVTRVVNLLKEMQTTLQSEMDEDENLHKKLVCWCNDNEYQKKEAVASSEQTINKLEASVAGLTASITGLQAHLQEVETKLASDKQSLSEAETLHGNQQQEFHGNEMDSIQAIENLKAAIEVLSKHHGKPPKSSVAGGPIFKTEKDTWEALISVKSVSMRSSRWSDGQQAARMEHPLDVFLRENGLGMSAAPTSQSRLLQDSRSDSQAEDEAEADSDFSSEERALLDRAFKTASAFVQERRGGYFPAYSSQSGEILGVLKQLKEEMERELSNSQQGETQRKATFVDLRTAKKAEIAGGEQAAEKDEDQLATSSNALAEAKEDLKQERAALDANQQFLGHLEDTCSDAKNKFEARKKARLAEIDAVTEAVAILTEDQARDAMKGVYGFLQKTLSKTKSKEGRAQRRRLAGRLLRKAAHQAQSPMLAALATSVELDAFAQVKKSITKMITMLKVQQEDEVKKNDYCTSELHENEMMTSRAEDNKAELGVKSSRMADEITALETGIADAKGQVVQLHLDLQSAGEERKAENIEYQTTVQDQILTKEALRKALDRLSAYYEKEALLQKRAGEVPDGSAAAPVPQMSYAPSKAAAGVVQLLEKLIQEAGELLAAARQGEAAAQASYEGAVRDTNSAVAALQREVTTKTKALTSLQKERKQVLSDMSDTERELEGLSKYNAKVHADCDYLMHNFAARQEARGQEIEALQHATQILNGASLS